MAQIAPITVALAQRVPTSVTQYSYLPGVVSCVWCRRRFGSGSGLIGLKMHAKRFHNDTTTVQRIRCAISKTPKSTRLGLEPAPYRQRAHNARRPVDVKTDSLSLPSRRTASISAGFAQPPTRTETCASALSSIPPAADVRKGTDAVMRCVTQYRLTLRYAPIAR